MRKKKANPIYDPGCKGSPHLRAGYHSHLCSCGFSWSHGDLCAGNEKAHTCPKCGKLCWVKV